ncbi:MAG: YabP/YqfC family sporulation protein [Clostridia bacterium]|nr:YabP/YqfC family sporulation protein [Clostridia bacterium]
MSDTNKEGCVTLKDRRLLKISGVKGVLGFGEDFITLDTDLGRLCAEGRDMKILSLEKDAGEIVVTGEIDTLYYSKQKHIKGILSKFNT